MLRRSAGKSGETGRSWERGKVAFPLGLATSTLTSQPQLATCCLTLFALCAESCHFHFCTVIPEFLKPLPFLGSARISAPSTRQTRETRVAVHDTSDSLSL
jgi:hypothetical protein